MATSILRDLVNPKTTIGALFYVALFLLLAWLLTRTVRKAVAHVLKQDKEERIDRTTVHFVTRFAQIGIYMIAFLLYAHIVPALRSLGTALLAGVGLASIVVAFAAQTTLGNLIAGISLLLYRPFKVGEAIQVTTPNGVETGVLETLALGYTIVRTFDNRRIVIPNSVMANQVTINLSEPRMMAIVQMGLDYESDIDRARQIMVELAEKHPLVKEVAACPITELASEGVGLSLRAWCANIGDATQVKFDLYEQAKKRFDEEGIAISFAATNVVLKRE